MKFEMDFGFFGNNKISLETNDFDMIQIFQEFIQFQENYGWAVEYVAVPDDEEFDEDEEDTEEELDGAVAEAAAEAANKG
jgi:nucleosome binding factor SPN SPT16 subunit